MSGPDINRPLAGSNAIGSFIIGASPIGPISSFDIWSAVISQYANSPILMQLIQNMDQNIDPTANITAFFDNVFNVMTAQGQGLDVLGAIVGVSRIVNAPQSNSYLGFEEAAPTSEPLNQAPFFSGQQLTENFVLTDTAYRTLILAKMLFNISDGSIQAINQILLNLFPNRGNCYVVDGLDMTMEYKFEFVLTSVELAIVSQSGVLPRPSGVTVSVVIPAS